MAKKQEKQNLSRSITYNYITSPEKLAKVNDINKDLENDFADYLSSIDRSKGTIYQYRSILHVFWCWNLEYNNNKPFHKISKREFARFQNHALNEWNWSPKRIRTVKATLSSLSNFIENILDDEDEFEGYRSIIKKIESPADVEVRQKSVFSEKELNGLLDYLVSKGKYMKACALSLAMNSGRRKAELGRFKVEYFSDDNLICDGALYKTPELVTTKGRGSKGKQLELYTLAHKFKPYLDLWLEEREKLGIDSEWLFVKWTNVSGEYEYKPFEASNFDQWIDEFTKFLGKPFYWHALRHYFTTELKRANIPDDVIQSIVGWESADMVGVYSDLSKESQFEKYFGSGGIKEVRQSSLTEL